MRVRQCGDAAQAIDLIGSLLTNRFEGKCPLLKSSNIGIAALTLIVIGTFTLACTAVPSEPFTDGPLVEAECITRILSVENADLRMVQDGEEIRIDAEGRTTTLGWYGARLKLGESFWADDYLVVFDFIACAPRGIAGQAISPIETSVVLDPRFYGVRSIFIRAQNNSYEISTANYQHLFH